MEKNLPPKKRGGLRIFFVRVEGFNNPPFRAGLLILFLFFQIGRAYSEEGLSYNAAARMAVDHSMELRNEYAAKALHEGAWLSGIRAYLPRFGFTASEDDRLSQTGSDSFIKNYSVNFEQLIWDGGRLSLSRKLERAELDIAGSRLLEMASTIGDAAVSSYREVLLLRTFLEIRKKTKEFIEAQYLILKKEFELGIAREAEILEAEISIALVEIEILSLEMELEESERQMAEMLGVEELPFLSERIDIQKSFRAPSVNVVKALAVSRNLELAAIGLSVARRQAEAKAASLSWIPSLHLTGNFGLSGRHYPLSRYSWSLGLSIDFSSPWLSGNFGASYGMEPPFDRNARVQQTLVPAPDPGAVFSARKAVLALNVERLKYEAALEGILLAAERGVRNCALLDRRRLLALEALELETGKFHLTELKMTLGEITRIELMEAWLDLAKREADLAEAAVSLLRAERELEKLLNLSPGELSVIAEREVL